MRICKKGTHKWEECGFPGTETYRMICTKCNMNFNETTTGKIDNFIKDVLGFVFWIFIGIISLPFILIASIIVGLSRLQEQRRMRA